MTSPAKNQKNQKTTEELVADFVGRLGERDAEGIDGDDAVVFSTFSHTVIKNGRSLNNPAALHLTIANGQIVRMHLYEDT